MPAGSGLEVVRSSNPHAECSDHQQVAEKENFQAAKHQTFREFFPFPGG